MKIIVINGKPRAGKDLFVSLCQKHLLWCGNFSTVDFVKEIATECGWDGTKTPENRAFLSDLKDLLTNWGDVPYQKVEREVSLYRAKAICSDFSDNEILCFIHCREPREIAKFVENMGAETLLILRKAVDHDTQSNHADANVHGMAYDYVVKNDGTIEELEEKAVEFLRKLGYTIK